MQAGFGGTQGGQPLERGRGDGFGEEGMYFGRDVRTIAARIARIGPLGILRGVEVPASSAEAVRLDILVVMASQPTASLSPWPLSRASSPLLSSHPQSQGQPVRRRHH